MRNLNEAQWRDSARPLKFFMWDGRSVFPMVIFLMYMRLWTFILAIATMVFFTILMRYGFTPAVFLRWLRSAIAGRRKSAIPWWTN